MSQPEKRSQGLKRWGRLILYMWETSPQLEADWLGSARLIAGFSWDPVYLDLGFPQPWHTANPASSGDNPTAADNKIYSRNRESKSKASHSARKLSHDSCRCAAISIRHVSLRPGLADRLALDCLALPSNFS